MNKIISKNFVNMAKQGILGAILGIFAGEILGVLIYYIQTMQFFIFNQDPRHYIWATAAIPGGLGAGFGAVLGAIFGSISGLKDSTKK